MAGVIVGALYRDTSRRILERLYLWTRTAVSLDGLGSGEHTPNPGRAWCRPFLLDVGTLEEGMRGEHAFVAHRFLLFTEFYWPVGWNEGQEMDSVLDEWAAFWRGYDATGLTFFQLVRRPLGREPEGRYFQVNTEIPVTALGHVFVTGHEGLERMIFEQAGHGFTALNAVYRGGAGWAKAQGGSTGTIADGVVAAVSGDRFVVVNAGFVENVTHGKALGSYVWLSTGTAGLLSTAEPTAAPKVRMGRAVSTTTLLIHISQRST